MDASEQARLAELREYRLLDHPAGDELKAVVRLAAAVAGVPTATLNLIDEHRECRLTTVGFDAGDSPRTDSMCAVRLLDGRTVWTPDASRHPDYRDNPWVNGDRAGVRFYASAPLVTPSGNVLGTLCVFDLVPRQLSETQVRLLEDAATVVVALFEGRRQTRISADLAAETERQRAAFEASPLGMVVADAAGTFIRVNPAFAQLLGRPAAGVAGRNWRDFTHPDDVAAGDLRDRAVPANPTAVAEYDKRFVRPDGRVVWATIRLTALPGDGRDDRRDGGGEPLRLVQAVDITDRVDAERRARREKDRLHATIAAQRELLAVAADRDRVLQVAADRTAATFPAGSEVLIALADESTVRVSTVTGGLAPLLGTIVGARADGAGRDLALALAGDLALRDGIGSVIAAPLHDGEAVIGAIAVTAPTAAAFDGTDERQLTVLAAALDSALRHAADAASQARLLRQANDAIAAKQRSEDRFRLTFDNSPLGLTLASVEPGTFGRYLHANPAMTAITGYSTAELTTMTFRDLQHPDDVGSTTAYTHELMDGTRDTLTTERRYRHKDGRTIWVSVRVAVVRAADGHARYFVNQVEDITARRAADAQLRRQAQLLDLAPAAIIVRDLDGTIRWWNNGAERLYGWSLPAAAGRHAQRLLCTAYRSSDAESQLSALLRDGRWEGQVEQVSATGAGITTLSRQVLHQPDPGEAAQVLEVNTDITAARTAEQALADSEQRFRALFTNSAAGQLITALDGTIIDANPAYAAMLGYPHDQLAGRLDRDVLHPDDVDESRRRIADLFTGDLDAYIHQGRLRHADGHWVDVEATVTLIRDPAGKPSHIIAVVTDVTARRTAERSRDLASAELAARNRDLECANQLKLDLIGIFGQRIGAPVTTIRDHAGILTDHWADLDERRRLLAVDTIARQARQLDDTVHEVLTMVAGGAALR